VDQRRSLQRLSGLLPSQPLRREFAQFVVALRQQPAGRVRVAPTQGAQELGDVGLQPPMIPVISMVGPGSHDPLRSGV
jgi:hypothetical protein